MACFKKPDHLVEPILFIYMLTLFLQFPAIQALIYLKFCSQNYNETVCNNLSSITYKSEENNVQKNTSHWILYQNLALLVPSIFSAMKLGRIGDTVSRKWTILLPIIGQFLCSIIYLINAIYVQINLSYILIGPLLSGLCGGFTSLIMGIYSYVSHTTEIKARTVRMGILESMTFFSGTLGVILVGVLLDNFGFIVVFGIVFVLNCIALSYTIFVIKDITPEKVLTRQEIISDIFSLEGYRTAFKFFYKARGRNQNLILALGTLVICILMFSTAGDIDLSLLYLLHPPLSFSKTFISYYLGLDNCMKALPLVILFPLFKRCFSVNDSFWAVLGILSKAFGCILFGSSHVLWLVFCVPFVKMFQGFPSAVVRSLLSSIVENAEQGQLFAIVASSESIISVLASLTFNTLYAATVDINPGISFYVSAGIAFIGVILVFIIWRHSGKDIKYEHFVEVTESTEQSDEISSEDKIS